jgi:hypothetical protein
LSAQCAQAASRADACFALSPCAQEWETTVRRVGRWIDFEHDYKTMNPEFMESVWWVFKTLHEKGLVYRGFKVMPYSTACNTPLSNFEAGLDYRDVSDPAIMVAFPIIGDAEGASLVAWTTTPWTMPSNVALCVHPELQYVRARSPKGDIIVVAEARLPFMPGAAKPAKADKAGGEGKEKVSKGGAKSKGGPKPATGGDVAEAQPAAPEAAPTPAAAPSAGYTVLATMKGTDLVGASCFRIACRCRCMTRADVASACALHQGCVTSRSLTLRLPPLGRMPSAWWPTRT